MATVYPSDSASQVGAVITDEEREEVKTSLRIWKDALSDLDRLDEITAPLKKQRAEIVKLIKKQQRELTPYFLHWGTDRLRDSESGFSVTYSTTRKQSFPTLKKMLTTLVDDDNNYLVEEIQNVMQKHSKYKNTVDYKASIVE